MAWLAKTIPSLPGSGIVYTLTQRDADILSGWLQLNGIEAAAYHAGVDDQQEGLSTRELLEQKLLKNELKVLVATCALGMALTNRTWDSSFTSSVPVQLSILSAGWPGGTRSWRGLRFSPSRRGG